MDEYRQNKIAEVRPTSTFESFVPQHESQERAAHLLQSLAHSVIAEADIVADSQHPFEDACLVFLFGKPGRGKTHLVEAFINKVMAEAPQVRRKMVLSRGNFHYDYLTQENPYGEASVVVIDDMFREKMSVAELHPRGEIASLMKFITDLYDNRRLVIVTSNFPLLGAGIMDVVKQVDKIGRVTSRADEVMSLAGELELLGDDFRVQIAQNRAAARGKGQKISLFRQLSEGTET